MSPQQRETNDACDVTLMQKTSCDGLRIECSFSVEEAKHICGLEKEVRSILLYIHAFVSKIIFKHLLLNKMCAFYLSIPDGSMSRIHATMALQFENKNVSTIYLHG